MTGLYARLLRMYPASFRDRFGEEMLQFVRDETAPGRRVRWLRTFADLIASAIRQRWEEGRMRTKLGAGLVAIVVAYLASMLVVGSEFSVATALVMAAALAVVGVIGAASSLLGRRVRGAEYDYGSRPLRWWWVPAGLLGAAEIVVTAAQLIDDPKATNVFALLLGCAFATLVFAGMAIRNRRAGNYMIAVGVLPATTMFWLVFPAILAIIVIVNALADNVRIARPRPAV